MTDLQAAVDQALELDYRELLLCGCTGGRLDHTASNLVLLEWIADHGGRALLVDADNEVRLLDSGVLRLTNRPCYHYLSLVPLDRRVTGRHPAGTQISADRRGTHSRRHPLSE